MTGAENPTGPGRKIWRLFLWAWAAAILGLYLYSFKPTLLLMANSILGTAG